MPSQKFALHAFAVAALALSAGASHATITNTFTTLAAFNAATTAQGTDTFAGLSIVSGTPSPLNRATSVGTVYNYVADATPAGTFFGGGTPANPFLSTNTATDTITLRNFPSTVRAIGGNFFGSDIAGAFAVGTMVVTVTDTLGGTSTQTLTNAAQAGFLGFLSNTSIASLTITSTQPAAGFIWPSADNVVLAGVVPEPGTYALMLAGLAAVGAMARRRKA